MSESKEYVKVENSRVSDIQDAEMLEEVVNVIEERRAAMNFADEERRAAMNFAETFRTDDYYTIVKKIAGVIIRYVFSNDQLDSFKPMSRSDRSSLAEYYNGSPAETCCLMVFTCCMYACYSASKDEYLINKYKLHPREEINLDQINDRNYKTHKAKYQEFVDNHWQYLKMWDADNLSEILGLKRKFKLNYETYNYEEIDTLDKSIFDFIKNQENLVLIKKAVYALLKYEMKLI